MTPRRSPRPPKLSFAVPPPLFDALYREALIRHGGNISALAREVLERHVRRAGTCYLDDPLSSRAHGRRRAARTL